MAAQQIRQEGGSANRIGDFFSFFRGFSLFYRSTDLSKINVASYTTDTIGSTVNFGYPIGETQRLGFSFGANHTDITTGPYAVQEIRSSPQLQKNIDGYFISTANSDGTYSGTFPIWISTLP